MHDISDDAAGYTRLLALLATHGDTAELPVPVAIETPRGLLVACLRASGRPVFAVNPMAVARYRERYSVARKKSDARPMMHFDFQVGDLESTVALSATMAA